MKSGFSKKRFRQTKAHPKTEGNCVNVEFSLQEVLIPHSLKCSSCCPEHKTASEQGSDLKIKLMDPQEIVLTQNCVRSFE